VAEKRVAKKKQGGLSLVWRETLGELRKVTWPTRREALRLTQIVIIVIIITMILLGGLDYIFSRVFTWILS